MPVFWADLQPRGEDVKKFIPILCFIHEREDCFLHKKNTSLVVRACRLLQAKFPTCELTSIVLLFFFKLLYVQSLLLDVSKRARR